MERSKEGLWYSQPIEREQGDGRKQGMSHQNVHKRPRDASRSKWWRSGMAATTRQGEFAERTFPRAHFKFRGHRPKSLLPNARIWRPMLWCRSPSCRHQKLVANLVRDIFSIQVYLSGDF